MQESKNGITIIGLGPAGAELFTRQTWDWINEIEEIFLRTAQHPAVSGFPKGLKILSFDSIYEENTSFE